MIRVALVLLTLTALTACGPGTPPPPPAYKLTGDACSATDTAELAALTGDTSAKGEAEKLKPGYTGGACKWTFDGGKGYVMLNTFIAIHPTDEASKKMHDDFRVSDAKADASSDDKTVTDVKDLGTTAYLYREHDDKTPWKPADQWLYKFGVQHGTLTLTVLANGYAREADGWPSKEQDLQDKVKAIASGIMKKLAG
ncbi:hypothetical protein SAMN05421504_10887 [Amycolatopsis xylanica]|uniref:DUF3558 domain-containing protein n=1 Tax=Amycolatopsis xylanica TaxID=589385 RepID=A0A1H3PBB9_9PSEU|nr:hypothetical protein [Amycolatopsis xylanica]SDY97689.1 hypothetical protein SAMN05421504_10887 [Amycolatopsis xylanica]